jgi:hypothetical protein
MLLLVEQQLYLMLVLHQQQHLILEFQLELQVRQALRELRAPREQLEALAVYLLLLQRLQTTLFLQAILMSLSQ